MNFSRRKFLVILSLALLPFGGILARAKRGSLKPKKIIVIGAGFSGLACARALSDAGHGVMVLEARDRIGGRAHTLKLENLDLELGAAWIHGIEKNPIYELAKKAGTKTIPTDYFSLPVTFNAQGKLYPKPERERVNSLFAKIRTALLKAQKKLGSGDLSVETAFEGALLELGAGSSEISEQRHLLQTEIENDYAADASRLSLKAWDTIEEFDGTQEMVAGGYKVIADWLAKNLDIRLTSEVREIVYRKGAVRVRLADGTDHFADKVVVTVPLGVLQSGAIKFDPPLPARKQEALGRLEMGIFNKVFMKFPAAFWGSAATWIEYMAGNKKGWPMFLNMHAVNGRPVLCAFVVGSFAKEMESWPDAKIQSSLMNQLRKMYGQGIPDPEFIQITRWGSDQFARGSYSFVPVGSSTEDLVELGASVGDTLYFAGEHTSGRFQATVHAAYLTGIEAAKSIDRAVRLEA